ncbi:MAG: hypothetical protein RIT03_1678 [Bacteroidota bacterium]|jgi:broad specificity phosphatase PhoE
MLKTIYFIRHGEIYKRGNYDTLNEDGVVFSNKLPTLFKEERIDFIASVKGKQRCNDTINRLSEINSLKPVEYDKIDFLFLKPYYEALKYNTSVICYGVEEISEIFKLFSIEINKENKDSFYHRIIKISIDENNK